MATLKVGQIVKYLNPFPDEDPEQKYKILEVKVGEDDIRIDISPVNSELYYPPVYTVKSEDLVLIE